MSKVSNFIYCINAERVPVGDGNKGVLNARGVVSVLTPEFVPGTFSFSIVFSILGIEDSEITEIQIIFSKEGGTKLIDTGKVKLKLPPDLGDLDVPKEYKGADMSMDFRNVVFEEEGIYSTKIFLNGDLMIDTPIYVKGKR